MTVRPIEASTKDKTKGRTDYAAYYGEERWLGEIDDTAAGLIESGVDWRSAGHFGYDRLAAMRDARA